MSSSSDSKPVWPFVNGWTRPLPSINTHGQLSSSSLSSPAEAMRNPHLLVAHPHKRLETEKQIQKWQNEGAGEGPTGVAGDGVGREVERTYTGRRQDPGGWARSHAGHEDPELSQDPLLLTSNPDHHHRASSGSMTRNAYGGPGTWRLSTTTDAKGRQSMVYGREQREEAVRELKRVAEGSKTGTESSGSGPRKDEQQKPPRGSRLGQDTSKRVEGSENESDMNLGDDSGSKEDDELGAEFDLELSVEEEAALQKVEKKYAEEKKREKEMKKAKGKAKELSEDVQSRKTVEEGVRGSNEAGPSTTNDDRKEMRPAVGVDPGVVRKRRIDALKREIFSVGSAAGNGHNDRVQDDKGRAMAKNYAQATNEQQDKECPAWMEKCLEDQRQKSQEQAKAREERAKRRQEVKQQWEPPPAEGRLEFQGHTKKQKRQKRRGERKRTRREGKAELARLRECEQELLVLRASQIQGIAVPRLGVSLQKNRNAEMPVGTPTRVKVLRKARREQELWEDAQAQAVVPDSDCPTASASTVVVKEEPSSQLLDHITSDVEEEEHPNTASDGPIKLRTMRGEDGDGEFHFEIVVDLKDIGKRKRGKCRDSLTPDLEDDAGSIPTITKVAIALESTTEYRISVSGERPKKRVRGRHSFETGTRSGETTNGGEDDNVIGHAGVDKEDCLFR